MKAPEPAFRRLSAACMAVILLLLTSCSMTLSAEESPTGSTDARPVIASPEAATPLATVTATPTAEPTATATATATPDMTATAGADIRAQWVTSTHQILQIDSTLTDIGTRFQNGSLDSGSAAGQLRQLDQQAAAVTQAIGGLPSLPGVDDATLTHYRQSVAQWAAAIHDLDAKVAANDIFRAPAAVSRLEQVADDLEQQAAKLGLT